MENTMEITRMGYNGFRVEDLGFKIRSLGCRVLYVEFGVFGHA